MIPAKGRSIRGRHKTTSWDYQTSAIRKLFKVTRYLEIVYNCIRYSINISLTWDTVHCPGYQEQGNPKLISHTLREEAYSEMRTHSIPYKHQSTNRKSNSVIYR